jgi:hypothetical protein
VSRPFLSRTLSSCTYRDRVGQLLGLYRDEKHNQNPRPHFKARGAPFPLALAPAFQPLSTRRCFPQRARSGKPRRARPFLPDVSYAITRSSTASSQNEGRAGPDPHLGLRSHERITQPVFDSVCRKILPRILPSICHCSLWIPVIIARVRSFSDQRTWFRAGWIRRMARYGRLGSSRTHGCREGFRPVCPSYHGISGVQIGIGTRIVARLRTQGVHPCTAMTPTHPPA